MIGEIKIIILSLNVIGGWLIYETCVGLWVVLTNRESAYVPPTLMYQQAREKHKEWREWHE